MGNPGTNFDFAFFQNRMVNPYRKFLEPGFPHTFAKNDRQDLKMGCTDASRRQLQSVLKLGSKLIFGRNYGNFSFVITVPDHFPILTAFS
jgi:hypothetical protein